MKSTEINLLAELERPELAEMRKAFHLRSYPKGHIISRPDSTENLVFIITSGKIRVYLAYEVKEFTLAILGPGDIFSTHAGVYVEAFEETQLLAASIEVVSRGITQQPQFTTTMTRVLGNMLKSSFEIIGRLAFKDITQRLVDVFEEHAKTNALDNEEHNVLIDIGLTTEQLSNVLCATRQTVSTLLNDLAREGLLEKRGKGRFFIPDMQALRERAET